MNAREVIRHAIKGSEMVCNMYLEDLTDADLLVRPVPGANHIAWQLGHLIAAENGIVEAAFPGSMPPLPAGFKEKYTTETSRLDDAKAFHGKTELLNLLIQQRAGTMAVLDKITDADLDKPAPEHFKSFAPTIADILLLHGNHNLMHAGQWAVVRRKLGRAPLF
jgi:hypothetical protein